MFCLIEWTVGVTVYIMEDKQVLRELHYASGNEMGRTNVDNILMKLLNDTFGMDVLKSYRRKAPSNWHLLQMFKIKKHRIGIIHLKVDKKIIT